MCGGCIEKKKKTVSTQQPSQSICSLLSFTCTVVHRFTAMWLRWHNTVLNKLHTMSQHIKSVTVLNAPVGAVPQSQWRLAWCWAPLCPTSKTLCQWKQKHFATSHILVDDITFKSAYCKVLRTFSTSDWAILLCEGELKSTLNTAMATSRIMLNVLAQLHQANSVHSALKDNPPTHTPHSHLQVLGEKNSDHFNPSAE